MDSQVEITSIKDEHVVRARELSSAAGRRKWNACLLEGEEILRWALEAGLHVREVFCEKGKNVPVGLLPLLRDRSIPLYTVSQGILKKISDAHYVIPLIGVADTPARAEASWGDFVLVLDDVRDHGNIGTIFRTAKAFGLHTILSTSPDQDVYFKKIIEASRGTVFTAKFERFPDVTATLDALKRHGYQIIATSPRGSVLQSAARLEEKPVALIIGNETNGVSDAVLDAADLVVQIPMSSGIESLNVGVATGISLYEIKLKVVIQMLTKKIRQTMGREVNVAAKLIQGALDVRLREVCPFDSTQVITMMILKCDGGDDREQIARDTSLWGAELDEMLDPLLKDGGLIQDQDGVYRITGKGEELLAQLWGILEASEAELFHGFSIEDQRRFLEDLQRIQKNAIDIIGTNNKS